MQVLTNEYNELIKIIDTIKQEEEEVQRNEMEYNEVYQDYQEKNDEDEFKDNDSNEDGNDDISALLSQSLFDNNQEFSMRRFLYNHIYMPLVDRRDRNHGRNGFTFAGRIYQFLVSAYIKCIL